MKEEQTMSKRLSAKRRFTLILTVVAVLGIMMLVSLPGGMAGG
jgi:competence protein ComGC